MIFETLTLHNFGLYRGEQVLDLRPAGQNGKRAPIILFGGINGGGKTTILDAVKLALYGSRGKYASRSTMAYDELLRDSVNRGVSIATGASVALAFRITLDGEEHAYEIRRSWYQRGRTLRERVHVAKDGNADQYLADHWTDLVEEVIPLGVSQLFFFDAEQIRFLADDETAQNSLGAAIKSLLGLDLAERLIGDASVLESRFAEQTASVSTDPEIATLAAEIEAKEKEIERAKAERAGIENYLQRAKNAASDAEEAFAATGGKHWEERETRRQRLAELKAKHDAAAAHLVQLAAGALPLCLAGDLLASVRSQDAAEKTNADQSILDAMIAERDRRILDALAREGASTQVVRLVRKVQSADRRKQRVNSSAGSRLALSESARGHIARFQESVLAELRQETKGLLDQIDTTARELESAHRSLKTIPDDSDVADQLKRLQETTKDFAVLADRARRLDADIEALQAQRNEWNEKLLSRRRAAVESEIGSEQAARMVKLAVRTQHTMREFLQRATAAKIDHLSRLVTQSFRFLLRKSTLVHQVHIHPGTFAISLFDNEGQAVPKHRLSEGEKQVFAISVLWGLAQASPRPLPAIIDTPMARLDSQHRHHLINRYFPNASHQVIILSTDTEVDQDFYGALQPHITRAYHLDYDENEKVTTAREGYFWSIENAKGKERT